MGCTATWPGQHEGQVSLPRNKEFLKMAALGLAAAASASSGTDLVSEIFSPDDPDGEKPGGQETGTEIKVPKPKPDPAARLMTAAGCKTAADGSSNRRYFSGAEALAFPLVAPAGTGRGASILAGAGLMGTLGVGLNLADRVMNRNDPEYKKKSLIGDALKWGLVGGAISTGTNLMDASMKTSPGGPNRIQ